MTNSEITSRHWSIGKLIGRSLALIAVAWLAGQLWPVWLEPGPKTTVITAPMRPNNTIDYAAALNADCSQGVTPENNAVVLLVEAMGPGIFDASLTPEYFQVLGIESLPADGAYLQSLEITFPDVRDRQLRIWDEINMATSRMWSDEEFPDLARWLAVNETPLNRCVEATTRERFFDPLIRGSGGTLLDALFPLIQETRHVSRLLSLLAMRHLHQGNLDAALADSEAIYRLSRLVAQHPLLIPRLVACAHAAMAASLDGTIVGSRELSAAQARRHREFLQSLPAMPTAAETVDHGERFVTLDVVQVQFMGPKFNIGWVQPNAFLATINEGFDAIVAAMRQSDWATQEKELDDVAQKLRAQSKMDADAIARLIVNPRRAIPTQVAQVTTMLTAPVARQAVVATYRADIRHQMAIVGFALAEHRAVSDSYPVALDALVPDYLPSIPTDPFTGDPIHYVLNADRGTFLLYSLGENGIDDHGLMNRGKADDIGFGDVPKED